MPIKALVCPNCGAPVAPRLGGSVTCAYCRSTLTGVPEAAWAALLDAEDAEAAADGLTCCVSDVVYRIGGGLARGMRADVLMAERVRRPTELVVLKVLHSDVTNGLAGLQHEHAILTRLAASETRGAAFFSTLLPQPIGVGILRSAAFSPRPALVTRWRSGFDHTLADVRTAYSDGVDARTIVWMWRRVLTLLGWVHSAGIAHGSVVPEHVLIHPRDHGAVLVGWAKALPLDARRRALDIAMSARAIAYVAGSSALPDPLRRLLVDASEGRSRSTLVDAHALGEAVFSAANEAFGPPAFHPFSLAALA